MNSRMNPVTRTSRAFSLVEMLVVLVILAIVIAIIIPAIAGARRAAKNADTRATLAQIGNSVSLFENDVRRLPGYFGAKDMGAAVNATSAGGWTGCDNVMLDLLGGITTQVANPNAGIITVGPGGSAATQVNVDLSQLGATKQTGTGTTVRNYFTYDTKRFVAQSGAGQRFGGNNNNLFPSLVDAFGEPILAWVQDDVPAVQNFTAIDNSAGAAKYYWASNAGFLDDSVSSLGKQARDQRFANNGSILSSGVTQANRVKTLEALLGNPASPDSSTPAHPLSARGPIVFHSAGADGVFLGSQERGGKPGFVQYQANQDPFGGGPFDDLIYAAGH